MALLRRRRPCTENTYTPFLSKPRACTADCEVSDMLLRRWETSPSFPIFFSSARRAGFRVVETFLPKRLRACFSPGSDLLLYCCSTYPRSFFNGFFTFKYSDFLKWSRVEKAIKFFYGTEFPASPLTRPSKLRSYVLSG